MHAIHFGIDTNLGMSNLGTKIWKLVLDKVKLSKTQQSVFKSYVKFWSIDNSFEATKFLPYIIFVSATKISCKTTI